MFFSSCNHVPSSCSWCLLMPLIPILLVLPAGCYTAVLGKGRAQDGHVRGNPTLAVWPEVAPAALGYVDDHGAVPTATIPPKPIGLVGAPVDSFLCVTCASTERGGGKTQENECCNKFGLFSSLNCNFWCTLNQNVMCEECGCETPTLPDSWHAKYHSRECRGCSGVSWRTFTVDDVRDQQACPTTSTWVFAQGELCHLVVCSTVKGSLFIYSKKLFLVCCCEVQKRAG